MNVVSLLNSSSIERGDIISFGSNSSGRLGLGDNYLEVHSIVVCMRIALTRFSSLQ